MSLLLLMSWDLGHARCPGPFLPLDPSRSLLQQPNLPPLQVILDVDVVRIRTINTKASMFSATLYVTVTWNQTDCLALDPSGLLCDPITASGLPFVFIPNLLGSSDPAKTGPLINHQKCFPAGMSCVYLGLTMDLHHEFDLSNFWYDEQRLDITFESWWDSTSAVLSGPPGMVPPVLHEATMTPPSDHSGLPKGWKFVSMIRRSETIQYPSSQTLLFSFTSERISVTVSRVPSSWELKVRLPMLIISVFVLSTFVMGNSVAALETRITRCFESLLVYVAFGLYLSELIPMGAESNIADRLWVLSLLWSLAIMVLSIGLMQLLRFKSSDDAPQSPPAPTTPTTQSDGHMTRFVDGTGPAPSIFVSPTNQPFTKARSRTQGFLAAHPRARAFVGCCVRWLTVLADHLDRVNTILGTICGVLFIASYIEVGRP
eukprot:CAMPEP_0114564474 /NCGR_PEP_ID=MMETSP0114-20121206/13741_1 /TAXON_ID=31324 /ORGANISM="Goniomonas sp, Strain m" /LENGTH=429 /DNA_ID=CAMNT_0001750547 /DNA_START=1 /DNA_END=1290 /DNA_ORIENTATION=+